MFSELPKLFDRNFAIGYYLPIAIFFFASFELTTISNPPVFTLAIFAGNQPNDIIGITAIGLISWLGAIFLLAINRDIIRLMEGYGRFNPARLLIFIEKRNFKRLKEKISNLDKEYLACISENRDFPNNVRAERNNLMREIAERFPDEDRWLQPTSFGNSIRAFEVYPRLMYGLDAIPAWSRLLGVIPEDYRNLIDNAKTQVDFWCNLWLISIVFLAEVIGIILYLNTFSFFWITIVVLAIALIAYFRACASAVEWGDLVKSSFDLFILDLNKKLGFSIPATNEEQKLLWQKFSQAVIYTNPNSMPLKVSSTSTDASPKDE